MSSMPDSALAVADDLDENDGANMLRGDEAEAATGGSRLCGDSECKSLLPHVLV